jgi:hypothetical protein
VGSGKTARHLRIVGTATLPSIGLQLADHVSLGRGAMLPESTLLSIEHITDNSPFASFSSLPSTIAIDFDTGANRHSVVSRIIAADPDETPGGLYQQPRVLGAAVANAGQMSGQPLTLAIVFAAVTLISLSAIVVTSARRRRRELAVFRTLGLTRNQVRAVIGWHSATILVIAVVIGLPLGIAAGRWLWSSFATSIGAVPTTDVPGLALGLGLVALVVLGSALTALPAVVLSKSSPATVLRTA